MRKSLLNDVSLEELKQMRKEYTVKQMAELLDVSEQTVYNALRSKQNQVYEKDVMQPKCDVTKVGIEIKPIQPLQKKITFEHNDVTFIVDFENKKVLIENGDWYDIEQFYKEAITEAEIARFAREAVK